MTKVRCPGCFTVINVPRHIQDYIHDCYGQPKVPILGQEDVPIIGKWVDGDGTQDLSGTLSRIPLVGGQTDLLDGSEGQVDNPTRVPSRSVRGAPLDTTRVRSKFTYIDLQ